SLYGEVAAEVGTDNSGVAAEPASEPELTAGSINLTPEQKELIQQMSTSELRQFLLNGGADAELLQQIDDATLKAVVYEQLGLK
ncbi:MAG: hypothetical protein U1C53_00440, partial [Candidatus Veblenbacteria bacterium]|nr:hypothetical protein [Candidatus Veblenbacteria bacterium]